MTIRSFSGTHDFHATVLADTDAGTAGNADHIVSLIEAALCPRCEGPLPPEFPAGSRITQCRSIPICSRCGSDEAHQQARGRLENAGQWPIRVAEIEEREGRRHTEDGALPVVIPRNTGGWLQYGMREEGRRGD